jgi:hypothetical protein
VDSSLNPTHTDMVSEYLKSINNNQNQAYMLTIARDGEEPVRTIIFYQNAIEAAEAYNMYNDWGFAKQYLTVKLYEPSGKINEKVFKRNQAGDPTFLRQNYTDVSNVLITLKPLLEESVYQKSCIDICTSFAKDNWRFDPERFLKNLGIDVKLYA